MRSRRGWLLAAGVVLLSVPVAIALWARPTGPQPDVLPAQVRAELSARVARLLEADPAQTLIGARGGVLACAVHILGTDPPAADRTEQVRTAFGWALCETVRTDPASGVSVPVAVHLTDPVRVEVPQDGAGYSPSIRKVFPERLHDAVFEGDRHAVELRPVVDARAAELR